MDICDLLRGFDKIFFNDVGRGVDHFIGKKPIIGDDQQPGCVAIEPAYGEKAQIEMRKKVDDELFGADAGIRADKAMRFV